MKLSKDELLFLAELLSKVNFKIGQSKYLKIAEDILKKIDEEVKKINESNKD